ncbi:hypothetical protein U9M48_012157 [Paspalum notatum var. saurae]|uniref:Scarecrow-like protein 9 n=1 Tax=Paspalum notatum var. saurae TaxID=547442 RepID=A0AAQ3SXD0_PASNO
MAATPEEVEEGLVAEPEPFSPSIFLDLPPTPPRPDGVGEGPAVSSDDLMLPFISRVLMEEEDMDDDGLLHQFPDHPAFLQAQEPYAQILSAALLPPPDGGPIQPLPPPPYPDDTGLQGITDDGVGASFLPLAQGGDSPGHEQSPAQFLPAGDGDHAALASAFFSGHNGDMLSRAFQKGMEEAKKLLPTNNSLLINGEGEADATWGQNLTGGNGRGRKNKLDWGELEAEMCRKSKMMVPEPEETNEMVDEMIVNGPELYLKEMEALRIAMGSEARTKNTRKGKGKSEQGKRSTTEPSVDLSTLLIHCAQAVATDNRQSAAELLRQIKQHSSPQGNATQRLAHCFAEGLEARLAGSGSQVYRSLMADRVSTVEYLKAYWLYSAACCFKTMAFKFANRTICKAIAGNKKVHIVDYGLHYGFQWPNFLGSLSAREGGPPEVRITNIDLPQPGFRPPVQIEDTRRRLSNCALKLGVPFKFHSITWTGESIHVDDLNIDPDEVLIVNSIFHFGNLMDEGVDIDSPSPRDVVLSDIRKMKPNMFILFVMNVSFSAPFFVPRFREALFHYSAMFDMLDATAPRDNHQRFLVERNLFRQAALNVVACEGSDRVKRPETYKQWQVRNHKAGLRQLPLDPEVVKVVREKVRDKYHKDFVIDVDQQWLLEGWKGRILYAMSTWAADDAISEL